MNSNIPLNEEDIKGINRFTINARRIISEGYKIALENKAYEYLPIHLFLALMLDKNGVVTEVFNRLGIDVDATVLRVKNKLSQYSPTILNPIDSEVLTKPGFSVQTKNLLNEAFLVASDLNHVYVGTEHILLAMFRSTGIDFIEDVKKVGIDYESLRRTLISIGSYPLKDKEDDQKDDPFSSLGLPFGRDFIKGREDESQLPYFCRDMNEIALQGKYHNITGRDKEIQRLIHILSRKTKNNPILVGDAGVGKTAIVEGFVNLLVNKQLPASFINKKVMSLDISSIIAGARLRGDVEERIKGIIDEVVEDGDTILFIDEIHMIVGAGSSGGKDSLDIANILKPYLTSSELTVIGATTYDEYNKYFEEDSALKRRFQPIMVDEIDVDSAKEILYNLVPQFESFHKVKISKEAVDDAVTLSSKFIQERYLPDKAIDLLDEAAASVKIGREIAIEPELSSLGNKLLKIQEKKQKALDASNFEIASKFKTDEDVIVDEIENIIEGKKKPKTKFVQKVDSNLIRSIIVEWTKIPIAASDISDKTLKSLTQRLKENIVGQDKVVENVSLAIQRSHLGLNDEKRPLASFLFLGPTGVGKTELAKTLAKELFGSSNLLYQVDMSEFMEMHSVSKLIGSPPGYVGHQEGGQLTTFVRRKPYSVILFDEIEKAHTDTLNVLLQILEEGHLTDSKGVKVSFKNCIIIMTSNIGAEKVSKDAKLGFDIVVDEKPSAEIETAYDEMKEKILEELKFSLTPEFLNRIDSINVFRGLNKEDCYVISKNLVNELVLRLIEKGIMLNVTESVIKHINEQGYSKEYGGRNIRRKVTEVLEDGLAAFLLETKLVKKRKELLRIRVTYKNQKISFELEK